MGPKWDPKTDNFGAKLRFSEKSKNLQKHCTVVDFWCFCLSKNVLFRCWNLLKNDCEKNRQKKHQKIECEFMKMRLGPQHVDFSLFLRAQDGVKNRWFFSSWAQDGLQTLQDPPQDPPRRPKISFFNDFYWFFNEK